MAKMRPRQISSRGERSLDWSRRRQVQDVKFIPRLGRQGILRHELVRRLPRKSRLKPSRDIDCGQLFVLGDGVIAQFPRLPGDIRVLRVGLRAVGNLFARSHRHGPSDPTRYTGNENVVTSGSGSRNAHNKARSGDDAIVGAENRCVQPANALNCKTFSVKTKPDHSRLPARCCSCLPLSPLEAGAHLGSEQKVTERDWRRRSYAGDIQSSPSSALSCTCSRPAPSDSPPSPA